MNFQQVEDGKFLINIPEADNINHIVIFLTGTISLPIGLAGAVYFSWPDPNAPPNWQFLGMVNKKIVIETKNLKTILFRLHFEYKAISDF